MAADVRPRPGEMRNGRDAVVRGLPGACRMRSRVSGALLLALLAACGIPRDPDGTLERVRGGTVRVGVVHDPPWASLPADGEAYGIEPHLVRTLAAGLDAEIEWVAGGESALLRALEEGQLDLVVGGLTAANPHGATLALTRPYYTDSIVLAAGPDGRMPADLEGVRVGVEASRAGAAELVSRGAVPVPAEEVTRFPGPVAAPVWQLARAGRTPSEMVLVREERVFAAPPGENAWLSHVERFLHARRDSIPALLRRSGVP